MVLDLLVSLIYIIIFLLIIFATQLKLKKTFTSDAFKSNAASLYQESILLLGLDATITMTCILRILDLIGGLYPYSSTFFKDYSSELGFMFTIISYTVAFVFIIYCLNSEYFSAWTWFHIIVAANSLIMHVSEVCFNNLSVIPITRSVILCWLFISLIVLMKKYMNFLPRFQLISNVIATIALIGVICAVVIIFAVHVGDAISRVVYTKDIYSYLMEVTSVKLLRLRGLISLLELIPVLVIFASSESILIETGKITEENDSEVKLGGEEQKKEKEDANKDSMDSRADSYYKMI